MAAYKRTRMVGGVTEQGYTTHGSIVFGAAQHEHRPITVNGNMTACADCGVIILVPPEPVFYVNPMTLTAYEPTWGFE